MKPALPLLLLATLAAAAPAAVERRQVTETQTVTQTVHTCTEENGQATATNPPQTSTSSHSSSRSHYHHSSSSSSSASDAPILPAASTFSTVNPSAPPAKAVTTYGPMHPAFSSVMVPPPPPPPPVQQTYPAMPPPPAQVTTSSPSTSYPTQAPGGSGSGTCSLPGFGATLPGATLPFCCTKDKPCGTPQDAGAEATFYEMAGGTGACGTSEADTKSFVAVSAAIMGSLSSGNPMNPLCGRTVTVRNTKTGKTASGPVVDKCPGCKTAHGIDLSHGLYDQLAAEADGVFPVEWWFDF